MRHNTTRTKRNEELAEAYFVDRLSIPELSRRFKLHPNSIYRIIGEMGLSRAKVEGRAPRKRGEPTRHRIYSKCLPKDKLIQIRRDVMTYALKRVAKAIGKTPYLSQLAPVYYHPPAYFSGYMSKTWHPTSYKQAKKLLYEEALGVTDVPNGHRWAR